MQVKTCKDYYELMYEKFPDVPKADVRRAINHGWRLFYVLNSQGADTIINDLNFWTLTGKVKKDPIDFFKYYILKLAIKLKILHRRKGTLWEGYYYFALTDNLYLKYISQLKRRGRKRKYFKFEKIICYKLLDECKLKNASKKYIFRIPYIYMGNSFYVMEMETDKAELIITRNPLKFKDVLVYENKYDILC